MYSLLFFHVKYALQYTFVCEKLEHFLGETSPETQLAHTERQFSRFNSLRCSCSAPSDYTMQNPRPWGDRSWVGGPLNRFVPVKLGDVDAPACISRSGTAVDGNEEQNKM
jgi:hypothetical protein